MSSFPEPVALRDESTPSLGPRGRVRIELPHWAASVEIYDHDQRRVDDATIEDSGNDMVVCATLSPGAYQVSIGLGGLRKVQWASVLSSHTVTLPAQLWAGLELVGASGSLAEGGQAPSAREAARQASQHPPMAAFGGGSALLFLFLDGAGRSGRSQLRRLTLQAAGGGEVLDLREAMVSAAARGSWVAVHLSAPQGPYVLREAAVAGKGGRNQLVYLPDGRQAQVFLNGCDELLKSFTYNLADAHQGIDPTSEDTVASAVVLSALAHDRAEALVSANPKIESLLNGEHINPWLGVLAAYALEAGGEHVSDRGGRLRGQLRSFLLQTLPDHPDVQALYGSLDQGAADAPPMLRAGLRRLLGQAALAPGLCSPGSLLDRVAARLIVDSPWTAWPDFETDTTSADVSPRLEFELLQAVLPPSAPIFEVRTDPTSMSTDVVRDFSLATTGLEVLKHLSSHRASPEMEAAPADRIVRSLKRLSPEALSGITGFTFDAAAASLESLRAIASGDATLVRTGAPNLASIEALRFSVRDLIGVNTAEGAIGRSLEDDVRELMDCASELEQAKMPEGAELADKARALATKLLGRADLLVATDSEDRPLLANGAVQILSASLIATGAHLPWLTASAAVPDGWTRTEVRNATDQLLGYIRAHPSEPSPSNKGDLNAFREILPQLRLQSGLWLDGDESYRDGYRQGLEALLDRCDRLLG